jgi:hypothetical protein
MPTSRKDISIQPLVTARSAAKGYIHLIERSLGGGVWRVLAYPNWNKYRLATGQSMTPLPGKESLIPFGIDTGVPFPVTNKVSNSSMTTFGKLMSAKFLAKYMKAMAEPPDQPKKPKPAKDISNPQATNTIPPPVRGG